MGKRILVPLTVLLVAACTNSTGSDDPGPAGSTAPAETPTPSATAPATADPTSSFNPEPHPAAGIWYAELGAAILQFRLDEGPDEVITGVFDSPAEGVTDLPTVVTVDGTDLTLEIPVAAAVFEGTVEGDSLSGVWKQAGSEIPLVFSRRTESFAYDRPQEPMPPFPYSTSEVSFGDQGISLAGTLTIPEGEGPFPAAILISGSGQQDRDESIMGHKPFLLLADYLARAGVATLRYDDRGVGGSTGNPIGATTADFAEDARLAVDFLAGTEGVESIGLIGHSEGGLIAPMVASDSADVSFVVLLAGPGLPGSAVLATQTADLLRAEGAPRHLVDWQVAWTTDVIAVAASDEDAGTAEEMIRAIMETAAAEAPPDLASRVTAEAVDGIVAAYGDPWMRYFLAYDPRPALVALDVPTLAAIGTLDLQVSAADNLPEIELALAENADATVVDLDGLNHLFQTAGTGAVSEYASIEETMSAAVLELVAGWITDRF